MYTPRHFAMPERILAGFLAGCETAELVTAHGDGPLVTLLPVLWRPESGTLVAHLARVNTQWKQPRLGPALMVLNGPDHYIDPEWLPSFADSRVGVPTWNYVTVHAYGDLIVHEDEGWLWDAVEQLSARHGFALSGPGEAYQRSMLKAIVGVELRIERVEAKAKLSQNKAPADIEALVGALNSVDAADLARLTAEVALPHAEAREEVVAAAAARHVLRQAGPTA